MQKSQQVPMVQISSAIAEIYKQCYGRGPTRITVQFIGNAIVCLLEGVNAPAQEALVRFGRTDVAQTVHCELQAGMAEQMREVVEQVTGRTVRGHVPGFNARIATTTDVFLLETTAEH